MSYAELEETRVHYVLEGDRSLPVLVFSNSLGTDLHVWDDALPALLPDYCILRYDTRGHGESSAPAGPYTITGLGGDVLQLLDQLNIERFSFCGLSIGGMIGIGLALHAPGRITKLVLANTDARIGTAQSWSDRISSVRTGGLNAIANTILERWLSPQFRQSNPAATARLAKMFTSTSVAGYTACCSAIADADFTSQLKNIHVPSLVITGTRDSVTPPSAAHALTHAIAGAAYAELDAAHISPMERPREFAARIHTFLSQRNVDHG